MNVTTITGRLTNDPDTPSPTITKFSVAVDDYNSATRTNEAQFFDCVAFGKTAETAANYLRKGREVAITGRMRKSTWNDRSTGEKRSRWELYVDRLDLIGGRPAEARPTPPPSDGFELYSDR